MRNEIVAIVQPLPETISTWGREYFDLHCFTGHSNSLSHALYCNFHYGLMFVSFELESRKICSIFSFRYWFQFISFSSRTCKPEPESVITLLLGNLYFFTDINDTTFYHAACYGFMCLLLRFRRVVGNLCLPRDIGHSLS